ncbi:RDD family protein [Peribacillus sp. FSL H8-0477]|uniref:RDD family protein n=1 Tax=Peribacillus sp. FSL H8-0477 TaxID=2921388 RepID=UPI0030F4CBCC
MNASFLLRCKAFLIDYLFILIYLVVLFIFNVFLFPSLQDFFNGSLIVAQFTGFLMVTFPISLYFIISDSKMGGQSFVKRKTSIRVVGKNGDTLSILHATFRTLLKFLPWELSHFLVYRLIYIGDGEVPIIYYLIGGLIYALMFAYILTAIFTKKKQSLYDLLAKTEVVKVPAIKR